MKRNIVVRRLKDKGESPKLWGIIAKSRRERTEEKRLLK